MLFSYFTKLFRSIIPFIFCILLLNQMSLGITTNFGNVLITRAFIGKNNPDNWMISELDGVFRDTTNPSIASILMDYYYLRGSFTIAAYYLPEAYYSKRDNIFSWWRFAKLSEEQSNWDFARFGWKKAGFSPNVKYSIDKNQMLILDDFKTLDRWRKQKTIVNVFDEAVSSTPEGVVVSYKNRPGFRDALSYFLPLQDLNISNLNCLIFNVWIAKNSYLTVDIVVDQAAARLLKYQSGANQWENYHFLLNGDNLERILIGVGEPPGLSNAPAGVREVILHSLVLGPRSACVEK